MLLGRFRKNGRGAIYLFSVVLIAAMLVILVGSLVALERTTSTNIVNREEELSYFQLECLKAMENKISTVISMDPGGDSMQDALDETISLLREQAELRGMWQNITYEIDYQPSCLDLSPRRVTFDITTKSNDKTAYDIREFFLNDIFVSGDYLFIENRRIALRFRVSPGSDETAGSVEGGAVYLGSDVILASSAFTDYLNMTGWTNASSVYDYTVTEQPGLITLRMRNETAKMGLTKFLYIKLDEVQFQINVEPKVSTEKPLVYGIGLTPNVNGKSGDRFRVDNLSEAPLNPVPSWSNATGSNLTLEVERQNSWIVAYDDEPQPYALALILDEAAKMRFSSTGTDECVIETPARRGRFVVNGILRSYNSYNDAITEMRELKKLGKPPLGRTNYLEPLVLALTVDDLYFDPPAPKTNRRVNLVAWIENYGTRDADDVVVHFYDGVPEDDRSNLLGATNISSILNGDTEVCSTSWTFSKPGIHEIYVVVDPDQFLPDDPTDNVKHVPLKVTALEDPNDDIAVEALHIGGEDPSPGDTVSVSALVHNNGNRDEEDIVVRLQVINSTNMTRNISFMIIPNLPVDYYVTVPIGFIYEEGDERVRMYSEPIFNETDLTNNAREAYINSTGILIVADDNVGVADGLRGSTSLPEFLSALDDPVKYHITVWSEEERGDPALAALLFFDAVVWTCGSYDGHDVETGDASTLVDFIEAGGHLVLEGEDIAYRHHQNATGDPDEFLWNVTRSHIESYYDPNLGMYMPLDDVDFDGVVANPVPQINTYPTHPVMTNIPGYLPSNYTASYPDALLPINATELAVYESSNPNFLVLEDDIRSGTFSWSRASAEVSSPAFSGTMAFRSTGNDNFGYTFPYTVGDGADQYRFIDLWFYFRDSDADILLQVKDGDGDWNHRWGWDVQSSYDGYGWSRWGTTLNVPWGEWIHYRLDLVTDLRLSEGEQIKGLAFSADNGDVYYDHMRFARKDSWKSSLVAYEDATAGTKMVYMAYPVSAVENSTRKILIRNAIDWASGRTLNRAPLVTVTRPSGAEKFKGSEDVTWAASDPDGDVLYIDLYYSQNGGITWIDLARSLDNDGSWTWDTTTVPDGSYLVKAVADDNTLTSQDISPYFEVDNINDPPTVTVTRPNVAMRLSGTEQILWTAGDPDGDVLTYDIEWWDGSAWHSLISGYTPPNPSSPSYDWNTRTVADGVGYLIKVRASDGANTAEDVSDASFSIDNNNDNPTVTVTDPNGGEVWSGTKTVTWSMNDLDGIGAPLGDTLTATVDYESSDATFTGSYSPDSQGFFRRWLLLGGFSGNNIDSDYMGGESLALPWAGKTENGEKWWKHADSNTLIDLRSLMSPTPPVTGYAFAYVYNPVDRDLKMKVGSDDGIKVWVNGVEELRRDVWRGASPDQDTETVHLNQGWNTLLVKVNQGGGSWGFYFRFTDLADLPITDLNVALDRPNVYDTGLPDATGARLASVEDITNVNWDTRTVPNGNYTIMVTVDDGRGGVASDTSDAEFEVQNNRDPIVEVIYPNGGEILFGNVTVVWNATDPDGDDMTYRLYYKQGVGGWVLIKEITNSSWNWYLWDISGLPDSPPEYYIMVEARDGNGGLGWDVSDDGWYINNAEGEFGGGGAGNYTGYEDGEGNIGGSGTPPGWGGGGSGGGDDPDPADRLSMVMLLYPLGGETLDGTRTISWTHADFGSGLKFDIVVSRDSGATWTPLATGLTSTTYDWPTDNFPDGADYRIMVRGYDDESNEDTDSSNDFRVYNNQLPSISLISPTGGEWWSGIETITWSGNDPDGDGDNDPSTPYSLKYDVYYRDTPVSPWTQLATDITDTSLGWDTSTVSDGDEYRIRVVVKDGNIKGDTEEVIGGEFTIDNANGAPEVLTVYPSGGEKLRGTVDVSWSASDPDADPLTYFVYYSDDGGGTYNLLVGDFTGTGYSWDTTMVPDGISYYMKVEASDGEMSHSLTSDNVFIIDNTAPSVAIETPAYPPAPVVQGTIQVQGKVSDAGGSELDRVEVWVRGVLEGLATMVDGDDWTFDIDTTLLPEDATLTVEVRAYDGSGNEAIDAIQIKIDNVGN